eukprot:PhM_4_TR15240/c2_g1_i1/m.59409/K08730/PTDSS2; phosphatidylserine synthase 2
MVLMFAFGLNVEEARGYLIAFDPGLANRLPDKSYAEDCRLSTPEEPYKFFNTVADEFLLAHILGYWGKAVMLRDASMVIAVSVMFEFAELTFQHWQENFLECWWDHVIIDIMICNGGGMVLGLLTLRWLDAKEYAWQSLKRIPSIPGKAKRIAMQFTPHTWSRHKWAFFHSPRRALCFIGMLWAVLMQELNLFFLKYIFWMAPTHPIVLGRLFLMGLMAFPGTREWYEYATARPEDPQYRHRFGMASWLSFVIFLLEALLIVKFSPQANVFRRKTPAYIALPWMVSATLWVAWFVIRFGSGVGGISFFSAPKKTQSKARRVLSWVVFGLSWVPLLAMSAMASPDLRFYRDEFEAAFGPLWYNMF